MGNCFIHSAGHTTSNSPAADKPHDKQTAEAPFSIATTASNHSLPSLPLKQITQSVEAHESIEADHKQQSATAASTSVTHAASGAESSMESADRDDSDGALHQQQPSVSVDGARSSGSAAELTAVPQINSASPQLSTASSTQHLPPLASHPPSVDPISQRSVFLNSALLSLTLSFIPPSDYSNVRTVSKQWLASSKATTLCKHCMLAGSTLADDTFIAAHYRPSQLWHHECVD